MLPIEWIVICVSGSFGGFAVGLINSNSYKMRIPFRIKPDVRQNEKQNYEQVFEMGILGDILVGLAGSIAVFFFAEPMFGIKFGQGIDILRIAALGVLAGFGGTSLLQTMTSKLLKQIQEVEKKVESVEGSEEARAEKFIQLSEVIKLTTEAELLLKDGSKAARALSCCERALLIEPKNELASILKARALCYHDELDKAIDLLTEVIKRYPKSSRAYYNRSAFRCILLAQEDKKVTKKEVLDDLKEAIKEADFYREYARRDDDFSFLKDKNDVDFEHVLKTAPLSQDK